MKTKDWKEFQEYRLKLYLEWISSKQYKKIQKERIEIFKPVKYKFLWFNRESLPSPWFVSRELIRLDLEERMLKPYIPKETVEECLNWLIERYEHI